MRKNIHKKIIEVTALFYEGSVLIIEYGGMLNHNILKINVLWDNDVFSLCSFALTSIFSSRIISPIWQIADYREL